MINIEYLQLRNIADQNNATMGSDHPCRRGKADCCRTDLLLADSDAAYIREGIQHGDISSQTLVSAKDRARKGKKVCPFLSENKECTIYERRPLICIATGTMAIPSNAEDASIMKFTTNEGGIGLPFSKLSSSMCKGCHSTLAKQGKGVSAQALRDSQEIGRYYGDHTSIMMSQLIAEL